MKKLTSSQNLLLQLSIFAILALYYFYSISTFNFDKITRTGAFLGILSGFYLLNNRNIKKIYTVIALIGVITVGVLLDSYLRDTPLTFYFKNWRIVAIIYAFALVPAGLLYGISKIPIRESYKKAFAFALIIGLIQGVAGQFGKNIQTATNVVLWILAVSYLLNFEKNKRWIVIMVFATAFFVLNMIFGEFCRFIFSFLTALISVLLTFAILSSKLRKPAKITVMIVFTVLMAVFAWFGEANTRHYLLARLSKSKEENIVKEPYYIDYQLITAKDDTLNQDVLKEKNVAILFWSAACSHCSEEYPYFSDLAEEYAADTNTVFLAVYISAYDLQKVYTPLRERDMEFYNEKVKNEYSFQWAKALDGKKLMNDLKFNAFPQMTIINKDGLVVYNGFVNNRPWIWVDSPRKYLGKPQ